MRLPTKLQLCTMMFLNFFSWGMWFVTMGSYLASIGASSVQIGAAYGTQSLGAIIAPFVVGIIADRFLSAQKILGLLHISGAVLMYFIYRQENFSSFYSLLLPYMIVYMPTLALVNAITFKQLHNPEKEFSFYRVWGTIGWIVAGLIVGWLAWGGKDLGKTFLYTGAASAVLGLFSFFLPNTPPPKQGSSISVKEILGLDSLKLLLNRNYLVFFVASMLICIPLAFYYQNAEGFAKEVLKVKNAAGYMSIGQAAEMLFMFLMPWFFIRLGVKKMLLFAMVTWAIRYLCFGFAGDNGTWLVLLGIALHGICYDFFFVTGQIYTDKKAGVAIRSSAQGLITLATYGVGMYIGYMIAGSITGKYSVTNAAGEVVSRNWHYIWIFPCLFAAGVALLFFVFFKNEKHG
jgi:nucleoside transporter